MVAGRISAMLVAEGDRVKEGSVLAKIEDHSYRDQLQQAEASIDQAKATLENAGANRKRNADLVNRGIAAHKDLEDAVTTELVAEASLKQAQSAAALARLRQISFRLPGRPVMPDRTPCCAGSLLSERLSRRAFARNHCESTYLLLNVTYSYSM